MIVKASQDMAIAAVRRAKQPKNRSLTALERRIKFKFKDKELLLQALMHSSYVNEQLQQQRETIDLADNERLALLGDAVLELVVSEHLYRAFGQKFNKGELTVMRADFVCQEALYETSKRLRLGDYLYLSKGEELTGGRDKPKILSDALEALIAAIYLDGGYEAAFDFVYKFVIKPKKKF